MINCLSIAKQIYEKFNLVRTSKGYLNTCWYSETTKEEFTIKTLIDELDCFQKEKNIIFESKEVNDIWELIILMAPHKKNLSNKTFELVDD